MSIREALQRAREETDQTAKYTVENCPAYRCRFCGEFMFDPNRLHQSGHPKCQVPAWFRKELADIRRGDPEVTLEMLAGFLGVAVIVMKGWCSETPRFTRRGWRWRNKRAA